MRGFLARRVADIVDANPWLGSTLDYDQDGVVAAWYPRERHDAKGTPSLVVHDDFTEPFGFLSPKNTDNI